MILFTDFTDADKTGPPSEKGLNCKLTWDQIKKNKKQRSFIYKKTVQHVRAVTMDYIPAVKHLIYIWATPVLHLWYTCDTPDLQLVIHLSNSPVHTAVPALDARMQQSLGGGRSDLLGCSAASWTVIPHPVLPPPVQTHSAETQTPPPVQVHPAVLHVPVDTQWTISGHVLTLTFICETFLSKVTKWGTKYPSQQKDTE